MEETSVGSAGGPRRNFRFPWKALTQPQGVCFFKFLFGLALMSIGKSVTGNKNKPSGITEDGNTWQWGLVLRDIPKKIAGSANYTFTIFTEHYETRTLT
jgi:hypothetical protein